MIDLRFVAPELRRLDEVSAEVVACGVFRDARPLTGLAALLDRRMAGRLSKLAKQGFLLGEVGEVLVVPARPRLTFDKVLAYGMGPRASFAEATFRRVTERVLDTLKGLEVKKALLELPGRGDLAILPERAAEILLDLIGDEDRDVLSFVELPDGQRRIEQAEQRRRRGVLRAQAAH